MPKKLHPDIAATLKGPAHAAVKRLVLRCDAIAVSDTASPADKAFLVDVVNHVPPVRPHADAALLKHS